MDQLTRENISLMIFTYLAYRDKEKTVRRDR